MATTLTASMRSLSEISYQPTGQFGGEYRRTFTLHNAGIYPMRGGQSHYEPTRITLEWVTDGETWKFRHAILSGWKIDRRTGERTSFTASQTLYLGDPLYPDCEPPWLPALVQLHQPTITSHSERSSS